MLTFNVLFFFFYSFHKTQSHRLNWASESHSPVSLTVPLSLFLCISLSLSLSLFPSLSLAMEKLIEEERKARKGFQWSPLAPDEVVLSRLNIQHFLLETLDLE